MEVAYDVAARPRGVALDDEAAARHRRAVVIAEVEGEALCEADRVGLGILTLVVEVDMGLAGVAGVPAAPKQRPLLDLLPGADRDAAALEVREDQVGPRLGEPKHHPV